MNEISERHKKGFLPPRLWIFQFLNFGGVAERSRVRLQFFNREESGFEEDADTWVRIPPPPSVTKATLLQTV